MLVPPWIAVWHFLISATMKRCLEIFLIMRYLHVRSQELEGWEGWREGGSRGRLNRFANALQYALCLEPPAEGGREESGGSTCSGQVNGPQKRRNKSAQNGAKIPEGESGGLATERGEEEEEGKGRELRYVNFVCWQQTPKLSCPPKTDTHAHSANVSVINNYKTAAKTEQNEQKEKGRERERERENRNEKENGNWTETKRNLRNVFRIQNQQTIRQLKDTQARGRGRGAPSLGSRRAVGGALPCPVLPWHLLAFATWVAISNLANFLQRLTQNNRSVR